MKYYIYALIDGYDFFYIGKGTKDRMYAHYKKAKNTTIKSPVLDKIRKMIKEDKKITYKKMLTTDDETQAFEYEIKMINEIGRRDLKTGPLLNLTSGGEGVRDYKYTEKHRENLSNSIKKAIKEGRHTPPVNNSPRDYMKTEEFRNNTSNSMKEYYNSEAGQETKKQISDKLKSKLVNGKRILSDEARRKMNTVGKRKNK